MYLCLGEDESVAEFICHNLLSTLGVKSISKQEIFIHTDIIN
jgi:hypothetical protein